MVKKDNVIGQKMKKILVTGGAGFIGSTLVKVLQQSQYEVFVIDNLSFGQRHFISIPDDHFFEVDILNAAALKELIQAINPDGVIHLAAIHFIPYCNQHPFEAANINIQGTWNVLEAIKNTQTQKVVFASTAAIYPISNHPLHEDIPASPTDIYGLSKFTGEHLMHRFHLETSLPIIVCRFFNAIGPNETNPHLFPTILEQIKAGIRTIQLGNLTPKRDYIHVQDVAEVVNKLMNQWDKGYGVFNVGSGQEYSVIEIVEAFEEALGEKILVETDVTKVRHVDRMHLVADITKLKNTLNWTPSFNIRDAIKELL